MRQPSDLPRNAAQCRTREELWAAIEQLPRATAGQQCYRYECCAKCGHDWIHRYECIQAQPRVWGYTCLRCTPEVSHAG